MIKNVMLVYEGIMGVHPPLIDGPCQTDCNMSIHDDHRVIINPLLSNVYKFEGGN
jgi:hypothetical protein